MPVHEDDASTPGQSFRPVTVVGRGRPRGLAGDSIWHAAMNEVGAFAPTRICIIDIDGDDHLSIQNLRHGPVHS
jgi:hypothetical protein